MFAKTATILILLGVTLYGCQSNGNSHDGSRDGSYDGSRDNSAAADGNVPFDVPRGDTAEWNRGYQWEGPWGVPQRWSTAENDAETAQVRAHTINVELTDSAIDLPNRIAPGPIKFVVANAGTAPHRLVVEGNGMRYDLGRTLEPGESGVMQFELTPGTYMVYSPSSDDMRMGLRQQLEVTLP